MRELLIICGGLIFVSILVAAVFSFSSRPPPMDMREINHPDRFRYRPDLRAQKRRQEAIRRAAPDRPPARGRPFAPGREGVALGEGYSTVFPPEQPPDEAAASPAAVAPTPAMDVWGGDTARDMILAKEILDRRTPGPHRVR